MKVSWTSPIVVWARGLKRDIITLWHAARDPRVPLAAKIIAGTVAAYALSPIDLIPDFVPVIGWLDELILLPLGIALAIKLIDPDVLQDLRTRASKSESAQSSYLGGTFVVTIWIGLAAAALYAVPF